jgi:hypothetical protein
MMIGKKDQKKDTLAARARARAVEDAMMQAPSRRATSMDKPPMAPPQAMATPSKMSSPDMGAPPGMAPSMGMKKGGAVKKKPAMKSGGKVPPKKGGIMIMLAVGKKKGR